MSIIITPAVHLPHFIGQTSITMTGYTHGSCSWATICIEAVDPIDRIAYPNAVLNPYQGMVFRPTYSATAGYWPTASTYTIEFNDSIPKQFCPPKGVRVGGIPIIGSDKQAALNISPEGCMTIGVPAGFTRGMGFEYMTVTFLTAPHHSFLPGRSSVMPILGPELSIGNALEFAEPVDVKIETKTDVKIESKTDVKIEAKTDVKIESKIETKADVKIESKIETKTDVKIEVKVTDSGPHVTIGQKVTNMSSAVDEVAKNQSGLFDICIALAEKVKKLEEEHNKSKELITLFGEQIVTLGADNATSGRVIYNQALEIAALRERVRECDRTWDRALLTCSNSTAKQNQQISQLEAAILQIKKSMTDQRIAECSAGINAEWIEREVRGHKTVIAGMQGALFALDRRIAVTEGEIGSSLSAARDAVSD